MKLDTHKRTVDTDIGKAGSFGIKSENMSHIIDILRNKLYTNKHLAVLREYSINAVDAHIEKDIPLTPIKVTLPTLESPTLCIRDYGNGLNDDEILDTYIMYGSSTKRDSNSQTGGLGLGCKAGFAYGDMFNIINYGPNKITHWCAAIDESNLGSIYKTAEQPADGTSGVEIQIAVDLADRSKFKDEAIQLFKFFDIKPDVNLPEDESLALDVQLYGDNHDWFLLTQDTSTYYSRQNSGKATALMGNIPYTIDTSKLPSFDSSCIAECSRLVIRFPVGSLDIAASRESLEYTNKTARCVEIACNKVKAGLAQTITEKISGKLSLASASINAMELARSLPNSVHREVFEEANWKGQELINRFVGKIQINKHYRKHRWRADDYVNAKEELYAFSLTRNSRLITYNADELSPTAATLRLRTIQQQDDWNKKLEYFVFPYTKKKMKLDALEKQSENWSSTSVVPMQSIPINWFKNKKINEFLDTSYHLLEDATDITQVEAMKPKRQVVSSDGSVQSYEKIDTCIMRPHRTAAGRIVKSNDIEEFNGEVIYIPLDRYTWHGKAIDLEEDNFERIRNGVIEICQKLEYTGQPVIHGVKKHYIKKLSDKWISLDVWYAREFKKLLDKHPAAKQILPYTSSVHLASLVVNSNRIIDTYRKLANNKAIKFTAKSELRRIIKATDFSSTNEQFLCRLRHVLGILNKDLVEWKSLDEEERTFFNAHPMLKHCEPEWNHDTTQLHKEIKDYVTR